MRSMAASRRARRLADISDPVPPWYKGECSFVSTPPEFERACSQHDWDYTRKKKSRRQADRDFLALMLAAAGNDPDLTRRAWQRYRAVRALGWLPWIGVPIP